MKKSACDKCINIRQLVEIRTPGELTNAIKVIRANLSDYTLQDITRPAHAPSGEFADLREKGPWPDYVEHYFECIGCGRRFRLAVDTYHGAGGQWEGELETY